MGGDCVRIQAPEKPDDLVDKLLRTRSQPKGTATWVIGQPALVFDDMTANALLDAHVCEAITERRRPERGPI